MQIRCKLGPQGAHLGLVLGNNLGCLCKLDANEGCEVGNAKGVFMQNRC